MDINSLDDTKLLMQYFRKHDTDNNHKLDGLELLKAITRMEEEHKHDDEDDHHDEPEAPQDPEYRFSIEQIVPIVDSILEQDDKVTDPCLVSLLVSISLTIMFPVTFYQINQAILMFNQDQQQFCMNR